LELTETVLIEDIDDVIAKVGELKAQGVSFALDDFGTGYSSLSYLKQLPFDQLKIDRSFVHDVLDYPDDAAIARTIITLGNSLGLTVMAEGVETEGQRDFLAANGCHFFQGYLFSPPVPAGQLEQFVRQHGIRA
jgi:EAL domain-containing protein (putative c-di-GMP-specific phosphodiesterase class I)